MMRRRPRLRSLRGRLLVGVMVVTAVGLATADIVGATALQSYLVQQVDTQISIALNGVQGDLNADNRLIYLIPDNADDCTVVVTDSKGTLLTRFGSTDAVPTPSIADIRRYAAAATPVTVDDGELFRVKVTAVSGGRFLIVSESLKWSEAILGRLIIIEVVVSLMALALVAILALGVSRLVLRPLEKMSATAANIADGELSHRVELTGAPTEVARLGQSMNQMLGRIEDGFTQRQLAEDRLRRFVADASHELRTPLTSIIGYAQLARKGALRDPKALEDSMRRVEDEAKRMSSLVDELLLLARLDQGRPLDSAELDLTDLVTAAVADARAADPGRQLSLVVDRGAHAVLGDEARVRQAIGNLLANVRAHTPAGAAAQVRLSSDGGNEVVDVIDSGPGIEPAARERVFERFYRADSARQRVAGTNEGSGLGLSIVAAIAQAHHGQAIVLPHTGGAWLRLTIPSLTLQRERDDQHSTEHHVPSQL